MSDQDCTSWFEAAHAAKWLRMIVIATDHNLGTRGATVCEVMVHCTGRNGRRYSRPATGHRFQVALVANHLLAVQNVRCGRGVREVGPSSGAIGAAWRRRRRVRPSSNDGFSAREYRNDTLRKPTLNEYVYSVRVHAGAVGFSLQNGVILPAYMYSETYFVYPCVFCGAP